MPEPIDFASPALDESATPFRRSRRRWPGIPVWWRKHVAGLNRRMHSWPNKRRAYAKVKALKRAQKLARRRNR